VLVVFQSLSTIYEFHVPFPVVLVVLKSWKRLKHD
jgi:hypothetical protein